MKVFLKVVAVIVVLTLGSVLFFGCKVEKAAEEEAVEEVEKKETAEEVKEEAGEEPRELVLWEWAMTEIPQVVEPLYENFEKEYNVKLIIESLNLNDLMTKLTIGAESGELPDVAELFSAMLVPALGKKGALEPLSSYIAKEGGDEFLSKFNPNLLYRYKNEIYSLPILAFNAGLYYNKSILEENGFDSPPKTWDELVEIAKKCTDIGKGVYGFGINGNDSECLFNVASFIAQNEGRVGKVNGEIMINSPESVEALQFVIDLVNKYKVTPSFVTSDYKVIRELFMAGKLAMYIDGPNIAGWIVEKNPDFEWGTATLPKGKVVGSAVSTGDTEYGMFANSKNKDLAWEFVKFMTSEESIYSWCKQIPTLPANIAVSEKEDILSNPYVKPFIEQINLGNVIAVYDETPTQTLDATEKFKVEMQSVALGEKTVQEAMDEVAIFWDQLYEEQ